MSSRFFVAVLAAALALAVGCQDKSHSDHDMKGDDAAMKASMDACPDCAGVQTATAEGKCPVCGKPVKPMMKSPAGGTSSASSPDATKMVDACSHCPGVQVATADGKCPVCGAQVVQKQ
jgi:rubrerythrin